MTFVRSAKEAARHFLHRMGIRRHHAHLASGDRGERFRAIYDSGTWTYGRSDLPLSGEGSSLEATGPLRAELPRILRELGAKTLLDVGCGDFTWMAETPLPCDYVGIDIVPSVIERNIAAHSAPGRSFDVVDVVANPAPAADVVLCREVLFHLSFDDGLAALRNMLASGCSHLLLTSDRGTTFNADIETGDFRLLNLERRPFRFPAPIDEIDDAAVARGRFIGLWRAEEIRAALG